MSVAVSGTYNGVFMAVWNEYRSVASFGDTSLNSAATDLTDYLQVVRFFWIVSTGAEQSYFSDHKCSQPSGSVSNSALPILS